MTRTESERRLAKLEELIDKNNGIVKIEDLLSEGFPDSAAFPQYWYSTGPGARLALKLNKRAIFNGKLMQYEFVSLRVFEQEFRADKLKAERERRLAKDKLTRDFIARIRDSAGDE